MCTCGIYFDGNYRRIASRLSGWHLQLSDLIRNARIEKKEPPSTYIPLHLKVPLPPSLHSQHIEYETEHTIPCQKPCRVCHEWLWDGMDGMDHVPLTYFHIKNSTVWLDTRMESGTGLKNSQSACITKQINCCFLLLHCKSQL